MVNSASTEGISWHFNPPSAPHFGGLWEARVKSVKIHLYHVIGNQCLTYEELNTVLIQIEAFLNSRPLTPFSNDPNDLTALTPGSLADAPKMHQDFWRRWSSEYLHTLHQCAKWHKPIVNLSPGTLVLIRSDFAPPLQWHMGRVKEVHPGSDGVVRVATVQTSNGTLKRPVVKLCPLPLSSH
ncbi:uncharacterized protein LOC126739768 [Anthonomus grandis grandis]|uniref:uncharacterized protein LOC126739768 n=1 Tax=Anthonomus grandis grandis TaxID=2921223 RepID=UPI0021656EC6|nr:uncharacterized protein LOC126739768 [Anthonomus grandis grandis]